MGKRKGAREAKVFWTGRSQAIRLPKEFRFKGKEVWIKRMGNAVVLIPMDNPWESLIASLDMFSPDFMEERNQPQEQQVREDFFP